MTDQDHKALMREQMKKVGYKSPPVAHQFKPGQSGNPKGRPKGSKSLANRIADLLDKEVTINTENGVKRMTLSEAHAMKSHEYALKGCIKYLQLIMQCEAQTSVLKEDNRPQSAKEAELLQRLLISTLAAPENLEEIDDDGYAIDTNGKKWESEELVENFERRREKTTSE